MHSAGVFTFCWCNFLRCYVRHELQEDGSVVYLVGSKCSACYGTLHDFAWVCVSLGGKRPEEEQD
jgi:hypothetical protein